MTTPRSNFDSPWKQALEVYFPDFLSFFFPDIHADIDWSKGHEMLDKELEKVVRDADLGRRFADKLVKVWRRTGEERWVIIHAEVQGQQETKFAERMFVYNYRLRDRYNKLVVSLAVLTDEQVNWRPQQFSSEALWGTQITFKFAMVKLIDYGQDWSALDKNANPFATVVMAHLKTLETRDDAPLRKQWKFTLTRRLYEQGYQRQDVLNLYLFIDWLMQLPQGIEASFIKELEQYEREKQMPYVTTVERNAKERGRQEGLLEGALNAIELGLRLKFGQDGLQLLPEIAQISDLDLLQSIQSGLLEGKPLDELRAIYHGCDL